VFSTTKHVFALQAAIAEFGNGGIGVVEQPLLVAGIAPRPGDDARPVAGADPMLVGIDYRIEGGGIDHALFHEERFERPHAKGGIRRKRLMGVIVFALGSMRKVLAHCCASRRDRGRQEITSRRVHEAPSWFLARRQTANDKVPSYSREPTLLRRHKPRVGTTRKRAFAFPACRPCNGASKDRQATQA
jgi:hypothetical protein